MTPYPLNSRALTLRTLLTLLVACSPTPDDTDSSTTASTTATDPGTTSSSATTSTSTPTTGDGTTTDNSGTGTATSTATTTGEPQTDTGDTSDTGDTGTTGTPAICEGTTQTTLPGVTIVFPPQPCVFTLAEAMAGVTFEYSVEIAGPVDEVTPLPNDAGNCEQPGPSGLIVSSEIDGNGEHYCLCDQGLCPAPQDPPITLKPGSYPGSFEWTGVNWFGPSDTNNPFGPPFPPGEYLFSVRANGSVGPQAQPYEVRGDLPITLVP